MFAANETIELTIFPNGRSREATVVHADTEAIVVACHEEEAENLRPGANVQLMQVIDENIYLICTSILRCQSRFFTIPRRTPQMLERRQISRVACDLDACYFHEQIVQYKTELQEAGLGLARVLNLSMGGARLLVGHLLPLHSRFRVRIHLTHVEVITVEAEALRCIPAKTSLKESYPNFFFVASLKFIGLSRFEQLQIQRFLVTRRQSF